MTTHTLFFNENTTGNAVLVNESYPTVNRGDIIIFSTDLSTNGLMIVTSPEIFGIDSLREFEVSEGGPIYRRVLFTAPLGENDYTISDNTGFEGGASIYVNN